MATSSMGEVIQHLRRAVLLGDGAGRTDGQLLESFLRRRDEAALAALVRRHGPMVWGVCRRVLRNEADAEDAFQATFLVLVRRAASIASRELLANWLYGVARQTAWKARATAARRKERERQVTDLPEPAVAGPDFRGDLRPLLDEELGRLPDNYRSVVVLCDLEEQTRKEAARQLGVPEGTVAGWLARARTLLAERLARRGVVASAAALAVALSPNGASAGVPASVASSTIQAATGAVSAKAAALAEGVLKAMRLTKLKIVAAALVVLGVGALTCGIMAQGHRAVRGTGRDAVAAQSAEKDTPKDKGAFRGDAIPSGDDLRGRWEGEKNGINVALTFRGKKAVWRVEFSKPRKPKVPNQSPHLGAIVGADLKCVPDRKAGCLNLYLPAYLGDRKEIQKIPALTGRAPVGQVRKAADGTLRLRIIPTGYENQARGDYDYPAVGGLQLRRVAEASK